MTKFKKTLLILTLALTVAVPAGAKDIAYVANREGGTIVLTDVPCTKDTAVVYANSPSGRMLFGCWGTRREYIWVMWYPDQSMSMYPALSFTTIEK